MRNDYHNIEIVVNADRPDWGIIWGVAPKELRSGQCWRYTCTVKYIDTMRETEYKLKQLEQK